MQVKNTLDQALLDSSVQFLYSSIASDLLVDRSVQFAEHGVRDLVWACFRFSHCTTRVCISASIASALHLVKELSSSLGM
jgi:hypothetical protein